MKFIDEQKEETKISNSDRIIKQLDKIYPDYRDYQELIEQKKHEVDIIPFTILISTEENEYDMYCFDTLDEVKKHIKTTMEELSGWSISHVFWNGREIIYKIEIIMEC